MILGSQVRTRLLTHFHFIFSLKNSKSGGDERSQISRAESPVTNLPGAMTTKRLTNCQGPLSPCIMCVQYIGGCSVHRGDTMSTSRGYHEYIGGYHEYNGGYHEYIGGVQYIGGYHEYIGGCSVHQGDIMSTSRGYHEYIGG